MLNFNSEVNTLNSEINELLSITNNTIYFDNDDNVFKISNNFGLEVSLSLDKLIDIL